ncbi:MAG: DUF2752 domain-containing protein [Bacteroidota bacterium]
MGVLTVSAVLLYVFFNPEEENLFFAKCPIYSTMGIHCAGCGSQRAVHDLLNFRIEQAIGHNLLLFPAVVVIGQHLLTAYFLKNTKSWLRYTKAPIIILVVILLFMVLRNLKFYPFTYLAP